MKLGLITDIHEQVDSLEWAIDLFRRSGVEQIVVIGDLVESGKQIEQTCRLLAAEKSIGVWGNHDYGLCVQPDDRLRATYPPSVIDFMTSLQPSLEVAGCHFSHVEPWLNPNVIADLWYFEGPPDQPEKLDRIFRAVPNRIMFAGHFHQWLLATPASISDWHGDAPVLLNQGRYFVVIGALCEGHCATFDTTTSELVPFQQKRQPGQLLT